ncbi:MAG: hypothetical protein ACO3WK_13225 [Steroidobacteraceae bacterium]
MSIVTVEIPHQRKPIAWVAETESDFIVKVATDDMPDDIDFDGAVEWNGRDLSNQHVYRSMDEAARASLDGFAGHQGEAATTCLRDLVGDYAWAITDPALRLQVIGDGWKRARDEEREIAGIAYEAVRDAHSAGLPETQIASLLGVDRMTVRRALGKL